MPVYQEQNHQQIDQFQAIRLLIVLKPDANIMVWIQTVSQSSCAESLVSRHCEVTGSGDPDSISELIHPWTPSPTALWEVAETSGWVLAGGKRPALGPALEGRVSPPAPGLSASLRGLPRHVLPAMVFSLTTAEKHRSQVDRSLNSSAMLAMSVRPVLLRYLSSCGCMGTLI